MSDKQLVCYGHLKMTGEVVAIRQGEKGYFKTCYGVMPEKFVDEMNTAQGIDKPTADAMMICSMFGTWEKFESIRQNLASKWQAKAAAK